MAKRTVPASNFMATVAANVDNMAMSDKDFRQFIRNSLPIVIYEGSDNATKSIPAQDGSTYFGPYGSGSQDR